MVQKKLVRLSKIALLRPYLGRNGQHGPHSKSSSGNNIKGDYKLSRFFILSNIILTEL